MTLRKEIEHITYKEFKHIEANMAVDFKALSKTKKATDQICQLIKERLDFDCDRDMEFFEHKGVKVGFIPFETINTLITELSGEMMTLRKEINETM